VVDGGRFSDEVARGQALDAEAALGVRLGDAAGADDVDDRPGDGFESGGDLANDDAVAGLLFDRKGSEDTGRRERIAASGEGTGLPGLGCVRK
jgi:hypothetical protein